jgi:predicted nuclease of predicted toxin-antitoxin system
MKFLVNAQLPKRLASAINDAGHDALHTLDLADGNRTTDAYINELSIRNERIVITKDADFVDSLLLFQRPWKLLLISTGNITNNDLIQLFLPRLHTIVESFQSSSFVELSRNDLIIHR